MQYPVRAPGFEGRELVVRLNHWLSDAELWIDGQPAPQGDRRGTFRLQRNDGQQVTASLKHPLLDTIPLVQIDGATLRVVAPLRWYQLLWAGLPMLFVLIGGIVGGVLGFLAMSLNSRVFRTDLSPVMRYVAVLTITLTTFVLLNIVQVILISVL